MPIIEGPGGAGKSTLAKPLADRLGMDILKMAANGGQSVLEYVQKLECDGVIIDRRWVSEQIYSDLFGREPRIDNDDAEALTESCGRVGIPIIVLLPPPHVVISRLNARGATPQARYREVFGPYLGDRTTSRCRPTSRSTTSPYIVSITTSSWR